MLDSRIRTAARAAVVCGVLSGIFVGCANDDTGVEGSIKIGKDRDAIRDQIHGSSGGIADKDKAASKVATPGGNVQAKE
jgi:hypothetical protein